MLQVFCLAFAALLITLVVAYFNKPRQYGILWGGALILLIGTMLLLGLGIVDLFEDGHLKPATVFAVVLAIVISCGMVITAQEIRNKQKTKSNPENHRPTEDDSQTPGADTYEDIASHREPNCRIGGYLTDSTPRCPSGQSSTAKNPLPAVIPSLIACSKP